MLIHTMSRCHFDLTQGSSTGRYHTFVKYYLTPDISSIRRRSMRDLNRHTYTHGRRTRGRDFNLSRAAQSLRRFHFHSSASIFHFVTNQWRYQFGGFQLRRGSFPEPCRKGLRMSKLAFPLVWSQPCSTLISCEVILSSASSI